MVSQKNSKKKKKKKEKSKDLNLSFNWFYNNVINGGKPKVSHKMP
jgi:hypothetical protein